MSSSPPALGPGLRPPAPCPCGSGAPYDGCCGPLHRRERRAGTAEELMRSRYAAYVVGEPDHLFRTWHPRTRPADVVTAPGLVWQALEVLATESGGVGDEQGVVEFRATYSVGGRSGVLHEVSRFERRGGRWVYVDGDLRES
ncbi:MAG TPA: YchJ family metal-binding protein [Marmoricola sp.]|nr:YchJ family metal-binding protein [Marmoricola sp.]